MNDLKLKKHSHEFLEDGKLKVWVTVEESAKEQKAADRYKIGDFQVVVDANITKEDLDKTIKEEFEKRKEQLDRIKELGIGEEVK